MGIVIDATISLEHELRSREVRMTLINQPMSADLGRWEFKGQVYLVDGWNSSKQKILDYSCLGFIFQGIVAHFDYMEYFVTDGKGCACFLYVWKSESCSVKVTHRIDAKEMIKRLTIERIKKDIIY